MREQARLLALKIVVIALGVILVAMALVVFSTLIIRIVKGGGGSTPPAATAPASPAGSPAGAGAIPPASVAVVDAPPSGAGPAARVVSTALGEGKLAVTFEIGGRLVVVVHDVATGRELTRFTLSPAP
jgi:hypothetical protein